MIGRSSSRRNGPRTKSDRRVEEKFFMKKRKDDSFIEVSFFDGS